MLPIGQFGGTIRETGSDLTTLTVRRGHDLWSMEPEPGRLWLDAHGRFDTLEATAWTRAAVLGQRRDDPAPESVVAALGYLTRHGLVVEIDPDDPAAVDFARAHRLMPAAHGRGNRPAEPATFLAGFPPDQVAGFSWYLWRLWRESHLASNLWDGCLVLAETDTCVRNGIDARELLTELLRNLHVLLALRLAYVDVARLPADAGPETHPPGEIAPHSTDPDDLLVPVGHDLGPFYAEKDQPFSFYEICVGRTTYALPTNNDYAVWLRGHGPVDRPPLTYTRYRDALIDAGIPDGDGLAYRLAANGLLRQIPRTGDVAVEFARTHRITPLLTAIGTANADVPPGRWALGRPGVVFHHADEVEYWLWLWGGRFDSLWLACEALARSELGARTGDGDPNRCVGPVLLAVQNLILHALLFLDAAWDRR